MSQSKLSLLKLNVHNVIDILWTTLVSCLKGPMKPIQDSPHSIAAMLNDYTGDFVCFSSGLHTCYYLICHIENEEKTYKTTYYVLLLLTLCFLMVDVRDARLILCQAQFRQRNYVVHITVGASQQGEK